MHFGTEALFLIDFSVAVCKRTVSLKDFSFFSNSIELFRRGEDIKGSSENQTLQQGSGSGRKGFVMNRVDELNVYLKL